MMREKKRSCACAAFETGFGGLIASPSQEREYAGNSNPPDELRDVALVARRNVDLMSGPAFVKTTGSAVPRYHGSPEKKRCQRGW
jgi:hypothetical protein